MRHAPLNQGVYFAPRQPAWVNISPPSILQIGICVAMGWGGGGSGEGPGRVNINRQTFRASAV